MRRVLPNCHRLRTPPSRSKGRKEQVPNLVADIFRWTKAKLHHRPRNRAQHHHQSSRAPARYACRVPISSPDKEGGVVQVLAPYLELLLLQAILLTNRPRLDALELTPSELISGNARGLVRAAGLPACLVPFLSPSMRGLPLSLVVFV